MQGRLPRHEDGGRVVSLERKLDTHINILLLIVKLEESTGTGNGRFRRPASKNYCRQPECGSSSGVVCLSPLQTYSIYTVYPNISVRRQAACRVFPDTTSAEGFGLVCSNRTCPPMGIESCPGSPVLATGLGPAGGLRSKAAPVRIVVVVILIKRR